MSSSVTVAEQHLEDECVSARQLMQEKQWDNYLKWKERPGVKKQLQSFKYASALLPRDPLQAWKTNVTLIPSTLQKNLVGVSVKASAKPKLL